MDPRHHRKEKSRPAPHYRLEVNRLFDHFHEAENNPEKNLVALEKHIESALTSLIRRKSRYNGRIFELISIKIKEYLKESENPYYEALITLILSSTIHLSKEQGREKENHLLYTAFYEILHANMKLDKHRVNHYFVNEKAKEVYNRCLESFHLETDNHYHYKAFLFQKLLLDTLARTRDSRATKMLIDLAKKATDKAFRRNALTVLIAHFTAKISLSFSHERGLQLKDEILLLKKICSKNKKLTVQIMEQLTQKIIDDVSVPRESFFYDDIEFLQFIIVSVLVICLTIPALNELILGTFFETFDFGKATNAFDNLRRVFMENPFVFDTSNLNFRSLTPEKSTTSMLISIESNGDNNFRLDIKRENMVLADLVSELFVRTVVQNQLNENHLYVQMAHFMDKGILKYLENISPRDTLLYHNYLNRIFKSMINMLFYREILFIEIQEVDCDKEHFINLIECINTVGLNSSSKFIALLLYYHRNNPNVLLLLEHIFLTPQDSSEFTEFCSLCHDLNLIGGILYRNSLLTTLLILTLVSRENGLMAIVMRIRTSSPAKLRSFLVNFILLIKTCFDSANNLYMISIYRMAILLLTTALQKMIEEGENDDTLHFLRITTSLIKRFVYLDDHMQVFMSIEFPANFSVFETNFAYLNTFANGQGFFIDIVTIVIKLANSSKRRFMQLGSILCDQLFSSFSTVSINSQVVPAKYDWNIAREVGSLLITCSMGLKYEFSNFLDGLNVRKEDWNGFQREVSNLYNSPDDLKQFAILLRKTFEMHLYDLFLERGQINLPSDNVPAEVILKNFCSQDTFFMTIVQILNEYTESSLMKELSKAMLRTCLGIFKKDKAKAEQCYTLACFVIKILVLKKVLPPRFKGITDNFHKFSVQTVGDLMSLISVYVIQINPQLVQFGQIPKQNLQGISKELRLILLKEIIVLKDSYHQLIDIFDLKLQGGGMVPNQNQSNKDGNTVIE